MENNKTLVAVDINLPEVQSRGVAYYRITPEFRDFISKCQETYGVIGFEYTLGEMNIGVILKKI